MAENQRDSEFLAKIVDLAEHYAHFENAFLPVAVEHPIERIKNQNFALTLSYGRVNSMKLSASFGFGTLAVKTRLPISANFTPSASQIRWAIS